MSQVATAGRGFLRLFAPFIRVGQSYDSVARKWPLATGVVTTVLKTSAADAFAQKVIEGKQELDWKRNCLFAGYGFAYLGFFQYWLYSHAFVRLCRPITAVVGHWGASPVKTFIDQCIHHPFIYFPTFYLCKGFVEGRPATDSLTAYRHDLWENCKALWLVWVPAQLLNFAVVPLHLRVPFVAAVSFAWTVIISAMRGELHSVREGHAAAGADGAEGGAAHTHAPHPALPVCRPAELDEEELHIAHHGAAGVQHMAALSVGPAAVALAAVARSVREP